MRLSNTSLSILAAAALVASTGAGWAQSSSTTTTTTTITPEQQTTIYRTITHEQVAVQPPAVEWAPSVGVAVPEQVQLYDMPATIDVPTVRSDRYTVIGGHVVLVDPGTRRVVQVIEH
jgi:hypothetical protein